jgi:hypothetical protein
MDLLPPHEARLVRRVCGSWRRGGALPTPALKLAVTRKVVKAGGHLGWLLATFPAVTAAELRLEHCSDASFRAAVRQLRRLKGLRQLTLNSCCGAAQMSWACATSLAGVTSLHAHGICLGYAESQALPKMIGLKVRRSGAQAGAGGAGARSLRGARLRPAGARRVGAAQRLVQPTPRAHAPATHRARARAQACAQPHRHPLHAHPHDQPLLPPPPPPPPQELCLRCLYMDESCLPALARCASLTSLSLSFDNITWDASQLEAARDLLAPLAALTSLRSLELHCHTWPELAEVVRTAACHAPAAAAAAAAAAAWRRAWGVGGCGSSVRGTRALRCTWRLSCWH